MSFPDRLKKLRTEKGVSREELAQYIGLSWHSIAKWETGKRDPDTNAVIRLAEYFCVSTDYLLGKVSDPHAIALTPPLQEPPTKKSKKQRDLDEFLQQSDIMFKGVPLSDDAKDGVRKILNEVYGIAKEMNKRKK